MDSDNKNNQKIKQEYIARIADDGRKESVQSHSIDTAFLAENYAPEVLRSTAKLIALLHDAGKNCNEFLQYLIKSTKDRS